MNKKILSTITAGIVIMSAVSIFPANADNVPVLYFKSGENMDIVKVSADDVAKGDVAVRIGMYIDDSSNDVNSLVMKWKCDSEYITMTNLLNSCLSEGLDENNEYICSDYTLADGTVISSPYIPTCFIKISDTGKVSFQGSFQVAGEPDPITRRSPEAYSAVYQMGMKAVKWFTEDSDAYMISDFDAVIKQGTPDGLYKIYYTAPSDPDSISLDEWGSITYGTYDSSSKEFLPELKSITIQVGDPYVLGDVNQDGVIDSSDASVVLSAYASFSSGDGYKLTDTQIKCADVNHDGVIDSSDSSRILEYYAKHSSGKDDSFEN